jgi:hypothetical protein
MGGYGFDGVGSETPRFGNEEGGASGPKLQATNVADDETQKRLHRKTQTVRRAIPSIHFFEGKIRINFGDHFRMKWPYKTDL